MTSDHDTFLAENVHQQLDLRAAYKDLGERTKKWLIEIATELSTDSKRIGPPEPHDYRDAAATTLCYWVDCEVRDSREFSYLSLGLEFDSEIEYEGRTVAYACAWLTPQESKRIDDFKDKIVEIANREIVGAKPRPDGTVWKEEGSIGIKRKSRMREPRPPLSELEKDLRLLYTEALRLAGKLATRKG